MNLEYLKNKLIEIVGNKERVESLFWKMELQKLEKWYTGELASHYNTPSPGKEEKISARNLTDSSVLTWFKLHQQVKYLHDLELDEDAFSGLKLLDIGPGPIPSATVFKDCEVYYLDPLLDEYLKVGYPLHYYDNCRFIHAYSEKIPVEDSFFDAVISVNAIDHVNDINKTSMEIRRVLRDKGLFRMHVHYHMPTKWEPVGLTDDSFKEIFSWCSGLYKVGESGASYSMSSSSEEKFVLWSNF